MHYHNNVNPAQTQQTTNELLFPIQQARKHNLQLISSWCCFSSTILSSTVQ